MDIFQVVWTGGPLPWVDKPESHFHRVRVSEPDIATVGGRMAAAKVAGVGDNVFVFEVVCSKVGETEITLEVRSSISFTYFNCELSSDLLTQVGNKKSKFLPRPVVVESTVKISCGEPGNFWSQDHEPKSDLITFFLP